MEARQLGPPLVVYYLWPCPGWREVHATIWGRLRDSGLLEAAQAVHVGLAPVPDHDATPEAIDPTGKAQITGLVHPFSEIPTLHLVSRLAREAHPDTPLLYLHCRGARYAEEDKEFWPVRDHNAMMLHFLVERWREALAWMEKWQDVVACNIQLAPYLHVSGNFWWARTGALAKLEPPPLLPHEDSLEALLQHRNEADRWLGFLGRGVMFEMHGSHGTHHYQQRYPREAYVGT